MSRKTNRATRRVKQRRVQFVIDGLAVGMTVDHLIQSLMKHHRISRRQAERYVAEAREKITRQHRGSLESLQVLMLQRFDYLYREAVAHENLPLAHRIQRSQAYVILAMMKYPALLATLTEAPEEPFDIRDLTDEELAQLIAMATAIEARRQEDF